jgi:L-fuconolactonase
MVTEASWDDWTPEQLRPYVETVLAAFGPARTMFGSDWPVCLVASGYARWVATIQGFADRLTPDEQAQLFGGTAERVYRLH